MTKLRCPQCSATVDAAPGIPPVCARCGYGSAPTKAAAPQHLQCPQCSTVIAWTPGTHPACPRCGFGRTPDHVPLAPADFHAPPHRRPGAVIAAAAVVLLLLAGGAFAAIYATNPDLLGDLVPAGGGDITEQEMRSALTRLDLQASDESSDAWGMSSHFVVEPGLEGLRGQATVLLRFQEEPAEQAYESHLAVSSGGYSYAFGVKQKGKVINYVLGTPSEAGPSTLVGRDEDPATQPDPGALTGDKTEGGLTLDELMVDEAFVIDEKEPTKHRGKAATRFKGHNETATFEVVVYDGSRKLALAKISSPEVTGEAELLYGSDVEVRVTSTGPRASFVLDEESPIRFEAGGGFDGLEKDCKTGCTISSAHTQEVGWEEVEMRAVTDGGEASAPTVLASMRLSERSKTGAGILLQYEDTDRDGLVSAGDVYTFDPGSTDARLLFYDLWADAYEGGPAVPGPGLAALLVVLFVASALGAVRRRR